MKVVSTTDVRRKSIEEAKQPFIVSHYGRPIGVYAPFGDPIESDVIPTIDDIKFKAIEAIKKWGDTA